MLFELQKLQRKAKRKGRGIGSGKGGHTVGYGQKGQGSRGRGKVAPGFEGGNIPLYRKIPSLKGFKSIHEQPKAVNLRWIAAHTVAGDVVTIEMLSKVVKSQKIKIIGNTEMPHAITVKGIPVSQGAKAIIEKAGGKVEEK